MRTQRTKDSIRKIAEDENLTIKQVEEIVNSFFKFTAKSMKEGDKENFVFKTVRIFKFGVFRVKEGRKKHLKKVYGKRNKKK